MERSLGGTVDEAGKDLASTVGRGAEGDEVSQRLQEVGELDDPVVEVREALVAVGGGRHHTLRRRRDIARPSLEPVVDDGQVGDLVLAAGADVGAVSSEVEGDGRDSM